MGEIVVLEISMSDELGVDEGLKLNSFSRSEREVIIDCRPY